MNEPIRQEIHNTAKYLRNIRPLDPHEMTTYISEPVSASEIQQILRELSFGLDVVETEDGTFVPTEHRQISYKSTSTVDLPPQLIDEIETILETALGDRWWTGKSGEQLRQTIRSFKSRYFHQEPVEYDLAVSLGYLIYHFPKYYAAMQYILHELAQYNLLGARIRVFDIGAGVGGPLRGFFDFVPDDVLVEYIAVEPSKGADVLEDLIPTNRRNTRIEVVRSTAESFEPDQEADIILFANVLSELSDPSAVVNRYLSWLVEDGSVILLAPADRNTSIQLRMVERALVDRERQWNVFSPTVRLWPGYVPNDRGWSFDVKPPITPPRFQQQLDDAATTKQENDTRPGEFINTSIQYSYAIIRQDGKCRHQFRPSSRRYARFEQMESHVGERIDCVGIKLSNSLTDDGHPLFKISDGSERVDHYAVLTKETPSNSVIREAAYGDLLEFEGVLVLWNEDEHAYNIIVDATSFVDPIS